MKEQTPKSIDLRDQEQVSHDDFKVRLESVTDPLTKMARGELKDYVFSDGTFSTNRDDSPALLDTVRARILPPNSTQKPKSVAGFNVNEGMISLNEPRISPSGEPERFLKTKNVWFVVDDFGEKAAMLFTEPDPQMLEAWRESGKISDASSLE